MKVLYPAVMCAHRRELVFVHTSLIAVGRRLPSHREDALVEWVPAPYLAVRSASCLTVGVVNRSVHPPSALLSARVRIRRASSAYSAAALRRLD